MPPLPPWDGGRGGSRRPKRAAAGECRKEGFGVRGWQTPAASALWDFCGNGVEGMKFFLKSLSPPRGGGGPRAMGDAKEKERALGPSIDDVDAGGVGMEGPTLEEEESVRLRYQGFRES